MLRFSRFMGRAALALSLTGVAGSAMAVTELTVSSWLPPGYFFVTNALKPWAEQVEKESQGRLKVTILPAPIGRPAAAFDVVRQGQADISYGVHGYQPGRFELTKIVELPFTGNLGEAASAAYWRIYKKYLEQANEHRGVVLLSLYTHTPGHIFHTSKPMTRIEDFQGQKMRVGGGVVNEVAQALGFSPLLHPASEVYQILSNRVADGVLFTNDSIEGFKLENVLKYGTQIPGGLYNTSFFLAINEKKFRSLPKEDQELLMRLSGEHFARMAGKSYDDAAKGAFDVMKKHNIQVETASDELMKAIRDRTAPIEAAWVAEANKRGVDGRKALDELRQLTAELEAEYSKQNN